MHTAGEQGGQGRGGDGLQPHCGLRQHRGDRAGHAGLPGDDFDGGAEVVDRERGVRRRTEVVAVEEAVGALAGLEVAEQGIDQRQDAGIRVPARSARCHHGEHREHGAHGHPVRQVRGNSGGEFGLQACDDGIGAAHQQVEVRAIEFGLRVCGPSHG
ncbi:hypothetical protein [Cryobacterium sp.]|uniref:hypothetical protein n=1 Tax=Cryobacterium sp. TaxID=1926290 RepID=UPI002611889E|nr:hypothetical protein [Cryobacterium sp.]